MLETAHESAALLARLLELAGVAAIVFTVIIATASFLKAGFKGYGWQQAFEPYRANLGRGILLGLELLVGADIIATVTRSRASVYWAASC